MVLFLLVAFPYAWALSVSAGGNDPTSGVLPSYNDASANWVRAGLATIGGYPSRTTICATVSPLGNGQDDTSNIQTAINKCPTGEVVQLAAGHFSMRMSENIFLYKGITLRGSGMCNNSHSPYCPSTITIANGALPYVVGGACGASNSSKVTCWSNPAILMAPPGMVNRFDYGWSRCGHLTTSSPACGAVPLAADASQGQSTIRVRNTRAFSVGMWVLIDEQSGAAYTEDPADVEGASYGQVWATPDWISTSGYPATGRFAWAKHQPAMSEDFNSLTNFPFTNGSPGCWHSFCDRPTSELHRITSIGPGPCPGVSCTLTFDDPLTVAFRVSGGAQFTGSISGTALTVTSVASGTLAVNQPLYDVAGHITPGTYISAEGTGTGGAGTYTLNNSLTVSSETMTAGAHNAQVYWPARQNGIPMPLLQQAGVENISIQRSTAGGVTMLMCAYCWIKDVESSQWLGGGLNIFYSARPQLDADYVHTCYDPENNGGEYPIGIYDATTEALLENSITLLCGKGMVEETGAGNVTAYNYEDDTFYMPSVISDGWVEMSVNGSHYAASHHDLFEGNWGSNLDNDDTHGSVGYMTYFRNWGAGLRTPFTDPSNGQSVDDATKTSSGGINGPLRCAGPMLHSYWFAYVGNVCGTPGTSTSANHWAYTANYKQSLYTYKGVIWMLGWNSDAGCATCSDPNLDGTNKSFIFLHGNYDTVTAGVRWDSSYPDHALPNSFYLSSAPSYFGTGASGCTYPWPWITPTSATQIQPNSCGGSGLPAQARYKAGTPFVQP